MDESDEYEIPTSTAIKIMRRYRRQHGLSDRQVTTAARQRVLDDPAAALLADEPRAIAAREQPPRARSVMPRSPRPVPKTTEPRPPKRRASVAMKKSEELQRLEQKIIAKARAEVERQRAVAAFNSTYGSAPHLEPMIPSAARRVKFLPDGSAVLLEAEKYDREDEASIAEFDSRGFPRA
jgi:hypothetical protein